MTKVQYFTACTLDGYIADESNSLDWLYGSRTTRTTGSGTSRITSKQLAFESAELIGQRIRIVLSVGRSL